MKAFVMRSIGSVGFMEKPVPQPGPNDAVVRTAMALICTSDSHTVRGAIGPRENLTLGHEAVGIVHAVGDQVKLFKPGDRVVVGAITRTGAIRPRRRAIRRSPAGRWVAGSSPTPRMAFSPSTSMSTRPTRTWLAFPTVCPTKLLSTAVT